LNPFQRANTEKFLNKIYKMKIINSPLQDCYLIKEKVIKDKRGYFLETFNYDLFKEKIDLDYFIQENESYSQKKVIRGMHYQNEPYSQHKLIRVLSGKIWDIVIDLRPNSPSYLNSYGVELSQENGKQLYVPAGFAHGFAVTSDFARVIYKVNKPYMPNFETGFSPFDPQFSLKWPFSKQESILSNKDLNWPSFKKNVK
tara:strand:+ start:1655 stop:2251 length:597 start_codon:yes stop_codon:yes gene_type:complete